MKQASNSNHIQTAEDFLKDKIEYCSCGEKTDEVITYENALKALSLKEQEVKELYTWGLEEARKDVERWHKLADKNYKEMQQAKQQAKQSILKQVEDKINELYYSAMVNELYPEGKGYNICAMDLLDKIKQSLKEIK